MLKTLKNIFIKKNNLPCNGCTKCHYSGNRVTSVIILKEFSVLQGSEHTCIRKIPMAIILHRLSILVVCLSVVSIGVFFLNLN